jgi:uncharacterized protein YndB with AHSA1/START domain
MDTSYTISDDGRTLVAERTIAAPLEKVWSAWTKETRLEAWWAPTPWQAKTKSFDFKEGGKWHYCMEGPNGEQQWSLTSYLLIVPEASYTALDYFCTESGEINQDFPASHYEVQFDAEGELTRLIITTTYANPIDLTKVLEMGVREGFNQSLNQLEQLLQVA